MGYKKLICRVCGKEYEPCRSANKNSNVFHWQEVACSPECGAIYLQNINESRGISVAKKNKHKRQTEPVNEIKQDENAVEHNGAFIERTDAVPVDVSCDVSDYSDDSDKPHN